MSTIDKHTLEEEQPVRLCNYVDVYKHDRITASMPVMRATVSPEEIQRFRLCRGDVLITKDSETWNDIALYLGGADRDKLDPILDVCVSAYREQLDEDGQVDFKGQAKAFLRAYGFLSSILRYSNAD